MEAVLPVLSFGKAEGPAERNEEKGFEAVACHAETGETPKAGYSVPEGDCRTEFSGKSRKSKEYGIAVDIGTTTLAFQLVDGGSGRILDTVTSLNHQSRYGGDVISRIQASVNGKKQELQQSIRRDLAECTRLPLLIQVLSGELWRRSLE